MKPGGGGGFWPGKKFGGAGAVFGAKPRGGGGMKPAVVGGTLTGKPGSGGGLKSAGSKLEGTSWELIGRDGGSGGVATIKRYQ